MSAFYREEIKIVEVQKIYDDVEIPQYAKAGDAGMDVRAYFTNESRGIELVSGARAIIPTGIKVAIPRGYEIQVRPRSGLAIKEGLTVLNAPGTIDSGYRGEIGVILYNANPNSVKVQHGDRVAQLVLSKVPSIVWSEVENLSETDRGEGGFGSTGTE
jgi:dUTP pyrophosphatase